MQGLILLLAGYAALRVAGAVMRRPDLPAWSRLVGWLLCAVSTWLGAGVAGAYFPLWTAVAVGALGWAVTLWREGWWVRVGADVLVVGLAAGLSVPTLTIFHTLLLGLVVVGIGLGLDLSVSRQPKPRIVKLGFGLAAVAILGVAGFYLAERKGIPTARQLGTELRALTPYLPTLGITIKTSGQRVELPNGGVAWLEEPANRDPVGGALFFHGADPAGAQQKVARIIRRALLDAGFVVLSVDHPGFGDSALPTDLLDWEAWDPRPHGLAALAELEKRVNREDILLVGHSMGCVEVLHLSAARPEVRGAVLFGAGLADLEDLKGYWHGRFRQDRGIEQELPVELVRKVRSQYYDNARAAAALGPGHPPIQFVRFSGEHENVQAKRNELYDLFPGKKQAWDVAPSDHYFHTVDVAGLAAGDTRSARACRRVLRAIQQALYADRAETAAADSRNREGMNVPG